jgi:LPS O-antigen subunit length determinant protein (WzzB/FepE family)
MNQNVVTTNSLHDKEGTVDLLELIRFFISKKNTLIKTAILGVIFSIVYILISPSIYRSSATFFVPEEEIGDLSKYASFLGGSTSGNLEERVKSIFESYRLKLAITNFIYPEYEELINEQKDLLTRDEKIKFLMKYLDFKNNFKLSKDKSGLFEVSCENTNASISLKIVQSSLIEVERIFHVMEFGSKKAIFKHMDFPLLIEEPVAPRKILILIIGPFIGVLLGIFSLFFKDIISQL